MAQSTSTTPTFHAEFYASFRTSDEVTIRYLDIGSGPSLVLLHGLGQTSAQFAKQIEAFTTTHRVIAVDMRGHGESDKVGFGYRISRLAADLRELIEAVGPDKPTILGHSMGSSVIWAYHEMFGLDGFVGLVLVDQPPAIVIQPHWSKEQVRAYGAFLSPDEVFDVARKLRTERQLASSPFMNSTDRGFFASRHSLFPAEHEATLFINHAFQDWRDAFARIDTPSLVIAGEERSDTCEWIVQQLPNAVGRVFSLADRGSHFMYWDNAPLFNNIVRTFMERP